MNLILEPADLPISFAPERRRGGGVLVVDFHETGNSASYRTFGWSGQEDDHVWSIDASSGLCLPAMAEPTPLCLDIDFAATTIDSIITTSVVRVFVNGHAVGTAAITARSRLRCTIPEAYLPQGEPIMVRFEHPNYVRIDMTDLGSEDRLLAMCFYSVCLYPPWMGEAATALAPSPGDCPWIEAEPPAPPSDARGVAAVYRFGAGAHDRGLLRAGWRLDEAGHTWADARHCYLDLPAPDRPGQYQARFNIVPLFIRSTLETQRITILLGGAVLGQYRTGVAATLSIPLPPELVQPGGTLSFALVLPDGVPMHEFDPSQDRHFLSLILESIEIVPLPRHEFAWAGQRADDLLPPTPLAVSDRFLDETVDELPLAIKREFGRDIADVMGLFESVGDNCAFGLAQRKTGCETLGLLRFASTPLTSLVTGLRDEFRAVGDTGELKMRWVPNDPGEFILSADRYGIRWHTNVFDIETDQDALFAQQAMRLSYLRRKFYEGLNAGRKIFAISRAEPLKHPIPIPDADEPDWWEGLPEPLRLSDVVPLFLKLHEYGTNTLLYMTRCERDRRSGTVELIMPGIMRGYVDDFVISADSRIRDHAAWMRIAANAWLLHQGANAPYHAKPAG